MAESTSSILQGLLSRNKRKMKKPKVTVAMKPLVPPRPVLRPHQDDVEDLDVPDREEQELDAYHADDDEDELDDDEDTSLSDNEKSPARKEEELYDDAFSEGPVHKAVALLAVPRGLPHRVLARRAGRKKSPPPKSPIVLSSDGEDSTAEMEVFGEEERENDKKMEEGDASADPVDVDGPCPDDRSPDRRALELWKESGAGEYDSDGGFVILSDEDEDPVLDDDDDDDDDDDEVPLEKPVIPSPIQQKPRNKKRAPPKKSNKPPPKKKKKRRSTRRGHVSVGGKVIMKAGQALAHAQQAAKQPNVPVHAKFAHVIREGERLPSFGSFHYNAVSVQNLTPFLVHKIGCREPSFLILGCRNTQGRLCAYGPETDVFRRLLSIPFPFAPVADQIGGSLDVTVRPQLRALHSYYYGEHTDLHEETLHYKLPTSGEECAFVLPPTEEYLREYGEWFEAMSKDRTYQRRLAKKAVEGRERPRDVEPKPPAPRKRREPVIQEPQNVVEDVPAPPPKRRKLNVGLSDYAAYRRAKALSDIAHALHTKNPIFPRVEAPAPFDQCLDYVIGEITHLEDRYRKQGWLDEKQ